MKISYDFGHTANGGDTSANGIVYEYAEIRKYAPVTIQALEKAGHTCVNCTPTQSGISLNDSLAYRVNKANASGSQLHLCFHVNAFNGSGHGAEIEVASDAGEKYAKPVLEEICKLGFTNRGIKRPSLYVTRHTNMPAILIEPFFCDNAGDCKLYNPGALGNAIAKGILRTIGGTAPQATKTSTSTTTKPKYSVEYQAHVQNIGWQPGVSDWEVAGTVGKSLRLEALTISTKAPFNIKFDGHIQNIGWSSDRTKGEIEGTVGQSKRLEAIKITLEGAPKNVHIEYQAHVQSIGWQPIVRDGAVAGTTGKSLRLEAIRIRIVED